MLKSRGGWKQSTQSYATTLGSVRNIVPLPASKCWQDLDLIDNNKVLVARHALELNADKDNPVFAENSRPLRLISKYRDAAHKGAHYSPIMPVPK